MKKDRIDKIAEEAMTVITSTIFSDKFRVALTRASNWIYEAIKNNGKIYVIGNGGSSSESSHLVAEFLNRYTMEREFALPAIDLSAFASTITAIGNDYAYEDIFAKQLGGLGTPKDVLVAFSTSGTSKNIVRAVQTAEKKGMKTILFTGAKEWFDNYQDLMCICVNSYVTPRIQEVNIIAIHMLCSLVDELCTQFDRGEE
jgi:D-sedoheptulose 7-phosphate isomerase